MARMEAHFLANPHEEAKASERMARRLVLVGRKNYPHGYPCGFYIPDRSAILAVRLPGLRQLADYFVETHYANP